MNDLILLHGALGHPGNFNDLSTALTTHFKVHTFAFYGHGDSDLPEKPILMQDYVDQLSAFCSTHNLEQPHIFGYSMGGYAALCYAAQNPGKVGSLVTLATKFDWNPEAARKEAGMLNPEVIQEKVPRFAAQLESIHGAKWRRLLPAIAQMMIDLGDKPLLTQEVCTQLQLPLQIMVGDHDNMVSLEESRKVAAWVPQSRFAVLPGTKHPIEQVRTSLLQHLLSDFWNIN
jgi:pimeloyl-ACP methyl ester carboxylesterase